jgi:hypothetical protein
MHPGCSHPQATLWEILLTGKFGNCALEISMTLARGGESCSGSGHRIETNRRLTSWFSHDFDVTINSSSEC